MMSIGKFLSQLLLHMYGYEVTYLTTHLIT